MLRTALKPRWLGLLALLAVVLVSFTWLGLWQLDVARNHDQSRAVLAAPSLPVAPLDRVIAPHQEFPATGSGRRVSASGRYDVAHQVLVADRRLEGVAGYWVATPLVVDGTGARIVVVRGFVTDPARATPPNSSGTVRVDGTLAPGESPAPAADLPAGQLRSIDLGALLNQWGGSIYNAFLFATDEHPQVTTAAITRVPPPSIQTHALTWRNAAYALQWWIFAIFAAYLYWRSVRDDWEKDKAQPTGPDRASAVRSAATSTQEKEAHV